MTKENYIIIVLCICTFLSFLLGAKLAYTDVINRCSEQESVIYKNDIPVIECGPIKTEQRI